MGGVAYPGAPARAAAWLALLFLSPAAVRAQVAPTSGLPPVPPDSVGLSPSVLAEVGATLDLWVAEERIAGGVVAVARRGRLAYLHTAGVQDLERRAPMTERSIFRIYSMAKPVTAVAAMMLRDEGAFDLDDPVSRYLPGFEAVRVADGGDGSPRPPTSPVTVRDLLLHTSGLSHRTSALYQELSVRRRDIPMARFLENITAAPLMDDPGTRFRYSEATTVLGALVEVWSGQALDAFLEARLFGPLGMRDTGFWVRPEQLPRLAEVYGPSAAGGLAPVEVEAVPFTVRPALLEGAVGLVSTAPDYLRFAQMLLNRGELDGVRILRAETVDEMTRNGLPEEILAARPGTMGWALANVNVVLDPAALNYPSSLGEYSWDGTAGTIFWVDPALELTIVLMTQSVPSNPSGLRQRIKTLVYEAVEGL